MIRKRAEIGGELCEGLAALSQNRRIGMWRDRKAMREIPGAEAPQLSVEANLDVAVFEDDAVLIPEDRKQHPLLEVGPCGAPVDVEIFGERRVPAPFQNVEPPGVVGTADGHVIGNEVEDETHIAAMQRIDERGEIFLAAELGIEPVMVDDIVAVGRAGARLHDWRGVDMADPKLGNVGDEVGSVAKRETPMKLQPIGGPYRGGTLWPVAHVMVAVKRRWRSAAHRVFRPRRRAPVQLH